jgi:hypothetical protein
LLIFFLRDEGFVDVSLEIVSASLDDITVRYSKILKDALAMEVLDQLYVGTEWQIKERQKLNAPVKGTRS